jgi:eukaryotic-like serine/threonine-protein kinase
MRANHEAELRVALAEGLLTKTEAIALGEEAARVLRSPFELLVARGKLSSETLASLRASPEKPWDPDATATLDPLKAEQAAGRDAVAADLDATALAAGEIARAGGSPVFPASGWDRYQPIRFLGQGGMGMVFLARDARLHRNVAIKFVRGDDPASVPRFITEARAQARVSHERVCKVYEVGEIQGQVFIAMQYIDGEPLSVLGSQIAFEQKARILRDVALGVHEAHRQGIVHRDLKPANIMVERTEDGELRPHVMDFGLARTLQGGATETGTVLGTPHYMSPEQARGEVTRLDRRSDVYSLGATLYALLTGQPPISGSNALEVLSRIATEEPVSPRALDRDIPMDLESIALKCLEKDRSARYDSARALADDLERFLSGDPVQARVSGRWYRLRKRLAKHRRAVAATVVAAALLIAALGWGLKARGEAAERERLARTFTELVERIESMARYSALSRLHDIRGDQAAIRSRMSELEGEIKKAGPVAVGPGNYALGRGYLALDDEPRALEHLDSAWRHGFREPRVAYALALVTGHLYRQHLLDAEKIESKDQREAKKQEVRRLYRDPALAYLAESAGADVPSREYVAALVAFYEDRFDEALKQLDAIGGGLPWFYEAPALRGDILVARAAQRSERGDREGAVADFDAGQKACVTAGAIGASAPAVLSAMGELEYQALHMELYGEGNVKPHFERGVEAVERALAVSPDRYDSLVLEARLYRRFAEHVTNQGGEVDALLGKAVAAAEHAVAVAPAKAVARQELGRSHYQWGESRGERNQDPSAELAKASEVFASVGPGDQDYETHLYLGLVYQTWSEYEDQTGVDSRINRGKAIDAYLAAIRLDEQRTPAWVNLGATYFARAGLPRCDDPDGDLERARSVFDRATTLNPQHVVALYYGGQIRELMAARKRAHGGDARPDLNAALDRYREGLAINAGLPHLHNGIGSVFLALAREAWDSGGDPAALLDQARAAFEQAIAAAPAQGVSHHNLTQVLVQRALFQRARGEDPGATVREAIPLIKRAIALIPDQALPWANLGTVHALLADFELESARDPRSSVAEATAVFTEALHKNPGDTQSHRGLGEVRATQARYLDGRGQGKTGEFESAAEEFKKAIDLAPENQDLLLASGRFYRVWASSQSAAGRDSLPQSQRGLTLVNQVLERRPTWAEARVLRASLLLTQAQATHEGEERRALGRRAAEDFKGALAANANLEHVWRSEATRAEQLSAAR